MKTYTFPTVHLTKYCFQSWARITLSPSPRHNRICGVADYQHLPKDPQIIVIKHTSKYLGVT